MKNSMKAIVFRLSQGLVLEDVPAPVIKKDQIMIKVADVGFCGSDHSMIESGHLPDGYIVGHEVSGTVSAVGSDVRGVAEGLRVMVRPTFCGDCPDCKSGRPYFCQNGRRSIGIGDLPGAFAEYIVVYPGMIIPIPEGVDSRNAALAEAFAAALHAVNCAGRESGSALVIGGGPIGLATVMILKLKGFSPVSLSEPVADKRALGLKIGADHVIDPAAEDLGRHAFFKTGGIGFATIFECSGVKTLIQQGMDAAARGGTVCVVSVIYDHAAISPATLNFKEVTLTGSYSNTHAENRQCLEWMAAGKLDGRALISDEITLDQLPRIYKERVCTGTAVKVMVRIGEAF
jgi:(R,R)-butanediol dehydrogenase / meso-butanediol dehydrogenase / diacetyl reductase